MPIQVPIPQQPGEYRLHKYEERGEVVLCRVKYSDECPDYAHLLNGNECIIAFSPKCPHMGCSLVSGDKGTASEETQKTGFVRCPCHSSCFDLFARGLTVIGPATDWLAIMQLGPVADDGNQVQLIGWKTFGHAGRGIPFGKTSSEREIPEGDNT